MTRCAGYVLVFAVLALAAWPHATSPGATRSCPAPKARIINANATFLMVRYGRDGVYVCRRGRSAQYTIQNDTFSECLGSDCQRYGRHAFSRKAFIWVWLFGGKDRPTARRVLVWTGGKNLAREEPASSNLDTEITDLEASSPDRVAWIIEPERAIPGEPPADPSAKAVVRFKPGSGTEVVAQGANIEPGSLAVKGRHIYWIEGGAPRSALFP